MKKCLYCGCDVKNKYCNVSCQNKHQNKQKAEITQLKKYGELKEFDVMCEKCNKKFIVKEREIQHPKKEKYFCSRSCANSRVMCDKVKNKISETFSQKPKIIITKSCERCNKTFDVRYKRRKQKFCSRGCARLNNAKIMNEKNNGGKVSVLSQNRRSKNEIYFADLCLKHFSEVKTNEAIFNGWDADVIIEDFKLAILWNGVWHYKKISEKHSLKQVQNRDKIKIKEIKNCGYIPYIIKDMGKHDVKFVESEFEKLKIYLKQNH